MYICQVNDIDDDDLIFSIIFQIVCIHLMKLGDKPQSCSILSYSVFIAHLYS